MKKTKLNFPILHPQKGEHGKYVKCLCCGRTDGKHLLACYLTPVEIQIAETELRDENKK